MPAEEYGGDFDLLRFQQRLFERQFRGLFFLYIAIALVALYVCCYGWWISAEGSTTLEGKDATLVLEFSLIHFNRYYRVNGDT